VRLEMYGREIAEKGIMPYLDTIIRDAQMSDVMYLTISDTTAKEIFSTDTKTISKDVGQFLFELIENQSKSHTVQRKNLQDFLRIFYEVGQDNVLPIFEMHQRSEEHTSELQSRFDLVCRLLLEKKKHTT